MTRFSLRLPQRQARLVALAVAYHLARPGSELDRETMREYEHGLAEVPRLLEPQLQDEGATLELAPLQAILLSAALSSVINELKIHSVLDTMAGGSGRPRSAASGFDDKLRSLFPEVAAHPSAASDLAGEATMLRRQLPAALACEALRGRALRCSWDGAGQEAPLAVLQAVNRPSCPLYWVKTYRTAPPPFSGFG
jgi:hypothetical protein